jgi:hypothetical protein
LSLFGGAATAMFGANAHALQDRVNGGDAR